MNCQVVVARAESTQQALKARPDDADVHLDLARLEARQRRFDEAVKAADEAIRVRRNYADAYLAKAAIQELAGRPKLAEEAYQQGVTALPDVSRLRLAYAIFLIRDKRFDEGEKLLLDEYKARPVDGPLHREYDDQIPRFYLAAGRTDKALAWYRQRAEANAKDADSRFAMALILIARNELDEAQKTAEAIQEIEGVASGRALRLQGQVLVLRRQYKEALVKLLEAEKSNPRDADLLYNLGTCYLRTGDARKALVHLERVRALVPGNARVRRLLAEAYYTVGDFQKANELAEALKAAGETGMDLEVIQHDYDTRLGDVAEGEAGWRDFTEKHPERPEGWIGLADALVRRSKIAEGIAALEKAYELDKKSFRTTWSLALLYRQQKEYDKAIGVTKAALAEDANNLSLLGLLAQLYEMAGKPDDAVAAYERIRKLDPGNHIPYLAEAARALSKRPPDLVAAERGFREAYRLRPDDAIIRQRLVEVLLTGGRAADANALVDAAMRQNPTDVSLVVMKARVRLVEGNVDEGIRFYRLAMKTARDLKQEGQYYSLQYDLGQIYLRLGRVNEARAAFEEARDLKPDFVEARLALVQIAVQQQRYSDARAECLRVIEKKPAVTSTRSSASDAYLMALLTLGDIALSENNLPLARQYYERGAAEFPDASMPLRKRADVLLREKKLDEAVAELKKVVEVEKHDPAAVGLVADVLAGNGRADEALAFLKGEADKCPEPAAVYLFMGNVEASRKNWAKAREHYDASLNLRGDFARVYLAKAETYRAEKNVARAIEEARQAIKVDKTYEGSYVFLEQVYRDQNRPGDLRDLYQSWTAALGESVVAANNCAWFLAELQKEPDAALKVIEGYRTRMNDAGHRFPFAAELDDTEGRAWFAKGEYARAAELHERSLNQRRDSVKTWEHLRQDYAKLYERAKDQGDEAAALRYQGEVARAYNKVLELSPASFETQATLGDMRLAEGKVKEAIEAYQAALQIKKDPETKRKLTELLIRDGRLEDAGKLVAELLVEAPKDPGNLLLQGLLLSTSGKSDDAVKLLDSLVKDNPKMHMAHYLLAMEYVNRNDLEKAKTALDKVLELSPNFLGARLVKARLLASQQKFDEAVAECKAVLKGDPMSFEAAFNMGNFQLAQNKIPEAETTFRDLVKKWPDSVITHERLAETLRRGNRLGEALLEYQDARRQNPKALLLLRGQAGVLAAQNRPEQVLREYSAFLEDNPGATDAWIDLAQIHAQAQRWADAERALKSAVGTARSNIGIHGALINFYIDRRMLSEARGAAKRLIDEVGNAEAKGVGRTATARTFEIEGKLDEAVKEYRAAIDADPQQVVAVNNLGWLLLTRRNDADGAIALGEPYLQKAPGFAELFDTVGWAYRVKEDYKKAEPILQHSIAVQVQRQVVNPSIAYHYGEVLFLAGKPQEAKKWLEAALRVSFPEEAKAREILTKIQQSPADNK